MQSSFFHQIVVNVNPNYAGYENYYARDKPGRVSVAVSYEKPENVG